VELVKAHPLIISCLVEFGWYDYYRKVDTAFPDSPPGEVIRGRGNWNYTDCRPVTMQLRQRQEQLQSTRWKLESLLSDRKVELADLETVSRYMADLCNLLSESPLAKRESSIKSFVKEVRVTGTQVLLMYTIPMPPQGISREVIGVPLIVHYGGPWLTVPELFFTKKELIPALQKLIASCQRCTA